MTTTGTPERTLVRASDALWRSSPGFLALARSGAPHLAVHGPADVIWNVLETAITEARLLELLGAAYGVQPESIAADVVALLDSLIEAGYVTQLA